MTFIFAIFTFTMLQGFDHGQAPTGWISVKTVGINNSACVLLATDVENPDSTFTMYKTGEENGDGIYRKDRLEPNKKYHITVCFNNDVGNVQVIVKDGGYNTRFTDNLYTTRGACE
ncbi:MAG: hypothetical protein IPL53_20440 [Ignavibacteria bacterium]|nr:hypothetical protein [Ignavibacteria bacterium]